MSEIVAHIIGMSIAILGPLVNIGLNLKRPEASGMYLYWAVCLVFYIGVLIPFTRKSRLTLLKLIPLGIVIEDFFSNLWRSLIQGSEFLPFCNWYTQHFPFLGSLGEPTPYLLIPRWYLVALFFYFSINVFQYKEVIRKRLRKPM